MKKLLRNRGLVERWVLLERGASQIVSPVFLKYVFITIGIIFFVW